MSNQRPSSVIEFKNNQEGSKPTIDFDKNGVCSACNYTIMKKIKLIGVKEKNN